MVDNHRQKNSEERITGILFLLLCEVHKMITQIKSIRNVGKYELFCGSEQFEKNTMIFGFNGAGKSTLSDIFYSLALKEKAGMITRRRTLNRPDEHGEKEIEIILSD